MSRLSVLIVSAWFIVVASSCGNVKNFQYLQVVSDSAQISKVRHHQPLIQKGDLLAITVYSDDPLSTAAVIRQHSEMPSMTLSSNSQSSLSTSASGYLVNQEGYLQLYKLGFIRAVGLTKEQLADTLERVYANMDLLKNPYVEVRFLNYKVTVLGEVYRPGPYSIPTDKVNVFEAIGLAGDITQYGRRDNILIVRETNGIRTFGKLDLRDANVFLSPYYYLEQNDMVIVDVSKNKSSINNQNTYQAISIGATLISVSAVIYSLLRR